MIAAANQMDSHAEIAEVMGDTDRATQWRERAGRLRLAAMSALDE